MMLRLCAEVLLYVWSYDFHYIGTGNFLRKRVTIQNQQIRDPRYQNVASHLNPKYYIFPFYKMYLESTTLRRAKEKLFINSLKPKLNGLAKT